MMDSQKIQKLIKSYIQMLVYLRIQLENQCAPLSGHFKLIILFFQQFQLVGILTSLLTDQYSDELGFQHVLWHLGRITKPYLYLNSQDLFEEYFYLIPLAVFNTILALSFYLCLKFQISGNQIALPIDTLLKSNYVISLILYGYLYFAILFQKIFLVTSLQVNIISFKINIQLEGVYAINLVFIIIGLIFLFLFLIFEFLVSQESFNLKCINFKVLNQNNCHLYEIMTQITISLISILMEDNYGQFYLISALLFSNSVIQLVNIYYYQVAVYQDACYMIFTYSFTLSFTIIYVIFRMANVTRMEVLDSITLIFYPLILYLIMISYITIHNQIIFRESEIITLQQLQYQISFILDTLIDIKCSQNSMQYLLIQQYKLQHQYQCISTSCLCHKEIPEKNIVRLHIQDRVLHFNNLIQEEREDQVKFNYFLHYLTLINYLGMNTLAFQQANSTVQRSLSQHNFSETQTGGNARELLKSNSSNTRVQRDQIVKPIRLNKLGLIQTYKLLIIQEQIQKQLGTQIYESRVEGAADLSHAVKLFLQAEDNNKYIISTILKFLIDKKNFLTNINSFKSGIILYKECFDLVKNLKRFEDNLLYQYTQFPSQKMQSINTFFQAEILNNFSKAFKLASINSISDEKLMKVHAASSIDLFASKIDYIIVGFDNKSSNFKILRSSSYINEFFGLSKNTFKLLEAIDQLLPKGFDNFHHLMVQSFLQTGKSKFFRQIDFNISRYEMNYIRPIEFFFDINQTSLNELTFVSFLKEYQTMSGYLLVGSNNKCMGFSKNIVKKFNMDKSNLEQLQGLLKRQAIQKIIPDFFSIIEELQNNLSTLSEGTQYDQFYKVLFNLPSLEKQATTTLTTLDVASISYACDIVIKLRKITNEITYYVIEIREARRIYNSMATLGVEKYTSIVQKSIENIQPTLTRIYEHESVEDHEICHRQDINAANDLVSNQQDNNMIDIGDIPLEDQIMKPLDNDNEYVIQIKDYQVPMESIQFTSQQQEVLFSQRHSKINLMQGNQFFKSKQSLDVKENSDQDDNSQNIGLRASNTKNAIDQLVLQDIDLEVQEQIKQQMEQMNKDNIIDDGASQVSSIAGMRRSKFFKKYELIDGFLNSTRFSRNFDLMVLVLLIYTLVSFVESVLFVIDSSNDFKSFNQEINMLTIRNNLMGPLNKYIACSGAASIPLYYGVLFNIYTVEKAVARTEFMVSQIRQTYTELKTNLNYQQENTVTMKFFYNQQITVRQIALPWIYFNTIGLIESLNMYLEAFHQTLQQDITKLITIDINQSFFIYNYANYPTFNIKFQALNDEMLNYSINRSYQVNDRWIYTLIPFLACNFLLIFLSYYLYSQFKMQYQKFLDLFRNLDDHMIQQDLDRYKGIVNLILANEEVLFKYSFDISLKEKFMQQESNKFDQNAKNQFNKKKQLMKTQQRRQFVLPKFVSFSFFMVIYGIYFGVNFLQTQLGLIYFEKYPSTAEFFYLLSNTATASNEVFANKMLLLYHSAAPLNYYYYNEEDLSYFLSQFEFNIGIMSLFLQYTQQMSSESILTSTDFVANLTDFMTKDVCAQLPSNIQKEAEQDCDEAYDGVLRKGYADALVYIRNSLLNEQITSNNFTIFTLNFKIEIQAGVLASILLDQLTSQFKTALLNETNNRILLNSILSITYIVYEFLFVVIMLYVLRSYFVTEFDYVKRFTLLLPQSSLFLDVQIERQVRAIIINEHLL